MYNPVVKWQTKETPVRLIVTFEMMPSYLGLAVDAKTDFNLTGWWQMGYGAGSAVQCLPAMPVLKLQEPDYSVTA